MRLQLFINSVLCLCYVICALPKENNFEQDRPKRTIILKSMIKKLLWEKFSNFINLPITRRPSSYIYSTTARNRISLSTKRSFDFSSILRASSFSSPSGYFGASDPSDDSVTYGVTHPTSPTSIDSVQKNKHKHISTFQNQKFYEMQIPGERKNPKKQETKYYRPPVSSTETSFNFVNTYIDLNKEVEKQYNNNNSGLISGPAEDESYHFSRALIPSAENPVRSTDQNYRFPSAFENNGKNFKGSLFSGPGKNTNGPSTPSAEENNSPFFVSYKPILNGFSSSPLNSNDQRKQQFNMQSQTSIPFTGQIHRSSSRDYSSDSQSLIQNGEQFNNYPFNRNEHLGYNQKSNNLIYNSQIEPDIRIPNSGTARQLSEKGENLIQQRHLSPTATFLIDYNTHHQDQHLLPNVNKLTNSIQYADSTHSNYQHPTYNNNEASTDFNRQFYQPVLNFYTPEQQYQ